MSKVRLICEGEVDAIQDEVGGYNIFGVYVDDAFTPLDDFIRFGTPWAGEAPKFEDEEGNPVTVHGVYVDTHHGCYIAIEDDEHYKIYREVM